MIPMQKQNNEEVNQQIKASRILELNLELRDLQSKRKSVASAFTSRIKEVKQNILDILNNDQTAEEIVDNVHDFHDIKVIN